VDPIVHVHDLFAVNLQLILLEVQRHVLLMRTWAKHLRSWDCLMALSSLLKKPQASTEQEYSPLC
jgi:hypothetical protein